MAYIGNIPAEAYTNTVKDSFNGTGSATAFTLSQPTVTNDVRVVVENVVQDPTVAYSVSGTTLTFTSAPPSGTANIYVVHLGAAVMTAIPPAEIADATTFASSVTVQGAFTSLGIDDNANATAITIDSSENVLVGTTNVNIRDSSTNDGLVYRTGNSLDVTNNGNTVAIFNRNISDGEIVTFRKGAADVGSIGTQYGYLGIGTQNTGVYFHPTVPAVVPCDPSSAFVNRDNAIDIGVSNVRFKDLYLSGGVYLGGTGAANKLTDYEFGTWTPTLPNGGGVTINGAFYTKVGQQVHLQAQCTFGPPNNSTMFIIGGIPFVSKAGAATYSAGSLGYSAALNTSDWGDPLVQHSNGTYLYFHTLNGGAAVVNSAFANAGYNLIFSITYITNA
tara:strand:- start:526 stop:1692 length:1167 start_codon:yes stop_codon:yes gene_type:complete